MGAAASFCPDQPVPSDSNPLEIADEPSTGRKDRFAYNKAVAQKTVLAALHATRPPFLGPRKDTIHEYTDANDAAANGAGAGTSAIIGTRRAKDDSHRPACHRNAEVQFARQ